MKGEDAIKSNVSEGVVPAPHRGDVPGFEPGACIADRYRIAAQIGQGGMGRVYLAEDMRLQGRRRALKLTAALPGDRDAFIREAGLLSTLSHPLLPGIVDYYPPDAQGRAIIVMDYIAGPTLGELFARSSRRLPFARIGRYLDQLCEVLIYLHAQRPMIVFRDLKPGNVMIDHHDRAILVDFGIARPYRPDAAADTERLGTPAFAAPEQLSGRQTDARTDLYSWGALAFYLLSGGRAACQYPAGGHARQLQADVPAAFRELLAWTLSEEPNDRPQSASELLESLRQSLRRPGGESFEFAGQAPASHNAAREAGDPGGVTVVAVLSAYPGAGATLAALGLSRLLAEQGVHHAVVECPGGEPELHALLNGAAEMLPHAAFADPAGVGPAAPAWRRGSAAYYPLDPRAPTERLPEAGFAVWLQRLGVPLVLLDVSSRWLAPGMPQRLAECRPQSAWWVADCLPAKWTLRRQRLASDLQERLVREGTLFGWIANRDHAFAQRGDWLACYPAPPFARLPWLPAASVAQAVWRGEGFPADGLSAKGCRDALTKWAHAAAALPTS